MNKNRTSWKQRMTEKLRLFWLHFWAILAALFGIADFLTWSILESVPENQRLVWTLGIIIGSFVFAFFITSITKSASISIETALKYLDDARQKSKEGEFDEALDLIIKAKEIYPTHIEIRREEGSILLRKGDFAESIKIHSMLIHQDSENQKLP